MKGKHLPTFKKTSSTKLHPPKKPIQKKPASRSLCLIGAAAGLHDKEFLSRMGPHRRAFVQNLNRANTG